MATFNAFDIAATSEAAEVLGRFGVYDVDYVPPLVLMPAVVSSPAVQYAPEFEEATSLADYGFDVPVFPDVDATMTLSSERKVLVDALARRLLTPAGSLPFHPDYGMDLRQFLNDSISEQTLFAIKTATQVELEKDERVFRANALVSYDYATAKLSARIEVETDAGPFQFTLGVSSVSIELLETQ